MRTRSSRFFVVLLHLLGVSNHHLPSWYYELLTDTSSSDRPSFYSGIRGVHPHSIVLERLDLREVGGLDGVQWIVTEQQQRHPSAPGSRRPNLEGQTAAQTTKEPFWLQDTQDGKCLGPSGGFSDCGDATLWFILRRSTQRKSLRLGPFGVEETLEIANPDEPYRYALQIVDNDFDKQQLHEVKPSSTASSSKRESGFFSFDRWPWRQRRQEHDCLVPSSKLLHRSKRQYDVDDSSSSSSSASISPPSLELGSCKRHKTAWSWRVDPEGMLYLPVDTTPSNDRECVRRTKSSSAVLSSCKEKSDNRNQLVQFSLVRYHATTKPSSLSSPTTNRSQPRTRLVAPLSLAANEKEQESQELDEDDGSRRKGLPSTVDVAHSHASQLVRHSPLLELNLAGPLLSRLPSKEARIASDSSPFAAWKDSNPILFVDNGLQKVGGMKKTKKVAAVETQKAKIAQPSPQLGSAPQTPGRLRMEMNPYIAHSKDEIWVDPQTGLEYHTDLCQYLGHDRKEHGRHTLVGVGQFMKTMLKIKVYGIAFYVSKRDVLADPSFQQYAGLSAEELRKRPDFYEKLRSMPSADADPSEGGFFDRTLFLKTNMQLSTETMRSSLDSDWKMLSEEAKTLLIETSMTPRPADERMLAEVKRTDNPSHCSCAQTAPEEYEVDPSCCARGIELVFTWRKNGNVEVRLNGRLMDAFHRPDIGEGIFFEYLRQDDPFSLDFLERVVDGFPFLLAPLAQVQGITSSVLQQPSPTKAPESGGLNVFKVLGSTTDAVTSHAVGLAGAMQHGAAEAVANVGQAMHNAGDSMRYLSEEAERNRQALWKELVTMSQRNPSDVLADVVAKIRGEVDEVVDLEVEAAAEETQPSFDAPHGRVFRQTTSRWFGETLEVPDEIAPMVHPTMNKTILSLVHLYLLLILIVSFPPTNSNRTRCVVRRCKIISLSPGDPSFVSYAHEAEVSKRGASLKKDFKDNNGTASRKMAPELILHSRSAASPEYDVDPAREGDNSPQKIHIDLGLTEGGTSRRKGSFKGAKRLFTRGSKTPKAKRAHHSADCPDSIRSSVSECSSRSAPSNGSVLKKNGRKTDKMQKSLSYFL